jgi:hypothetical protein
MEEFCNCVFKPKTFAQGLSCLVSNDWSIYAKISYFLIDDKHDVDWIDIIVEHLSYWNSVDYSRLKVVEYSPQNENKVEKRLSNFIRANEPVIIQNAHQNFSWLRMILTKFSKNFDGNLAARVFVLLPCHQFHMHSVPFYGESRKVYCKAKLDFKDSLKFNSEIVIKFESNFLKLGLRKVLVNFHSAICNDAIFCCASLRLESTTLKDCLGTIQFLISRGSHAPFSEEDEVQSILWAVSAHYREISSDEFHLKRIMEVFNYCRQLEHTSKLSGHLTEKCDDLDVDAFVKSLPSASVLEFFGNRENRSKVCENLSNFSPKFQRIPSAAISKVLHIINMIPAEILLEQHRKVDWFLRTEIRTFNEEISYIKGVLDDCLHFRSHTDFKAIQYAIQCILRDTIPSFFPRQSRTNLSISSLVFNLTRKQSYYQAWLHGGPPKCHDMSVYYDINSFLAYLCVESPQAAQSCELSLNVTRITSAEDVSVRSSQGVFVDGLIACRCKWDARRRYFCSTTTSDESFSKLPICVLSLDFAIQGVSANRSSIPLYSIQYDDQALNSKQVAVTSLSVSIHDESLELLVGHNACLACAHN